jgi:hypothetical protein
MYTGYHYTAVVFRTHYFLLTAATTVLQVGHDNTTEELPLGQLSATS